MLWLSKLVNNFYERAFEKEANEVATTASALLQAIPLRPEPVAPELLKIQLTVLPTVFNQRGIYGTTKLDLPKRMRKVHPDTARAMIALEQAYPGVFFYSDVYRSAAESLRAVLDNRGAKSPSKSGHNYGFSTDDAYVENRKRLIDLGYKEFGKSNWKSVYDELKQGFGFYCHRLDGKSGKGAFEAWHYNHLGTNEYYLKQFRNQRSSHALEAKILDHYGQYFLHMGNEEVQLCLKKLSLYKGDIDGKIGPVSKQAIALFKKQGNLGDNEMDFKRTLAFVASEEVLVEL